MGRPALDLNHQRFGCLIATNTLRTNAYGHERERLCHCDCGKDAWVKTSYLMRGFTKSCGCFRKTFRNLSSGIAARNQVWRNYVTNARIRGLSWDLTNDEFDDLTQGRCFYCHRLPSNICVARRCDDDNFVYNGIDRLDNTMGYTCKNTVSCCSICNRAKGVLSVKEFLSWLRDIGKIYGQ